jgi:hypothetical protein
MAYDRFSYPLAYSIVVLPLSAARWSLFDHKKVPSAATFFGVSMFNLSGAINVALLRIVRPQLLLLTRPEPFEEPEIELPPGNIRDAVLSESAKYQLSPEPTSPALVDGTPLTLPLTPLTPLTHVSSRPSI